MGSVNSTWPVYLLPGILYTYKHDYSVVEDKFLDDVWVWQETLSNVLNLQVFQFVLVKLIFFRQSLLSLHLALSLSSHSDERKSMFTRWRMWVAGFAWGTEDSQADMDGGITVMS